MTESDCQPEALDSAPETMTQFASQESSGHGPIKESDGAHCHVD